MPQESYEEYRDKYFDYTKYDPSAQFPTIATRGFDTYGTGLRFPEDASRGVYQYERQDPIFYDYKPERYDPQELEAQRRINEFFLSKVAPAPSQTPPVTVTDVPKASPSILEVRSEPKKEIGSQTTSLPSSGSLTKTQAVKDDVSQINTLVLIGLGIGALLLWRR